MLRVTYLGDSNDMAAEPIPQGFKISPSDAVQIAMRHNGPKKTVDDFYIDDENYYICDGFSGSIPQTAIDNGLIINGETGQIYDRESKTWKPDPRDENQIR